MSNTFGTKAKLKVNQTDFTYYDLPTLARTFPTVSQLPFSLKILLENLLRCENGLSVRKEDIIALANWNPKAEPDTEIAFTPSRVLMQDFTGVPAIVDLAAMRDAMKRLGGDPKKINPLQPAELVIDHSVQVDEFGSSSAFVQNTELEYQRNQERYVFLRWGQNSFQNFRVVPPQTGIVHQVNLEYLARVVFLDPSTSTLYPDTLVGTDSHTTMVNGLGVLGWGVGGIEAEAAMLGQPVSMLIPQVVGFKLSGKLPQGTTATDLVLTITQILRKRGVVGKFVEFFGPGISELSLADRATIANMAPEYGATCGIFPVDHETLKYLKTTNRNANQIQVVEEYFKKQEMFHTKDSPISMYSDVLELNLGTVEPSLAGPSRPQDRVALKNVQTSFGDALGKLKESAKKAIPTLLSSGGTVVMPGYHDTQGLKDGSVVIAAITSCTNTSNPSVMVAAGLLAKKAIDRGLQTKSWVKTSLAPGSKVVHDYLVKAGLLKYLESLHFHIVGYGCTTCIGNSGPLPKGFSERIRAEGLVVASVLSGNRNFEGRVHPDVRANYLASPPLVVAYALTGKITIDWDNEPIGNDSSGLPVYLRDIWPSQEEVNATLRTAITQEQFASIYNQVFLGDEHWQSLSIPSGDLFAWNNDSTYIKNPPFFEGMTKTPPGVKKIQNARVLAVLGDSITTDHISPAGSIKLDSPAGQYLINRGVEPKDFNQYGARRGNFEVMVRGTFANVRLRNSLAGGVEGGMTKCLLDGKIMPIYDAAQIYIKNHIPTIILAGKEYGSGSSRDWAAKGTMLLGVRAVIAQSYERIHRSNLVGMGVLPLEFTKGENATSLGLSGEETFHFDDLENLINSSFNNGREMVVRAVRSSGTEIRFKVLIRIDTPQEILYYQHGGILPYVLRQLTNNK